MATSDKLEYLAETKELIKEALRAKGQSVADTATFRSYVNVINDMEPAINQDKVITENGTYEADEGYTGLGTVTVNVPTSGGGSEDPVVVDEAKSYIFYDEQEALDFKGYGIGDKAFVFDVCSIPLHPDLLRDIGQNLPIYTGMTSSSDNGEIRFHFPQTVTLKNTMNFDNGIDIPVTTEKGEGRAKLWLTLTETSAKVSISGFSLVSDYALYTSADGLTYTFDGTYMESGTKYPNMNWEMLSTHIAELIEALETNWENLVLLSKFVHISDRQVLKKIYTYTPNVPLPYSIELTENDKVYLIDIQKTIIKGDNIWFQSTRNKYAIKDALDVINAVGGNAEGSVYFTNTDDIYVILGTYTVTALFTNLSDNYIVATSITEDKLFKYNKTSKQVTSLSFLGEYTDTEGTVYKKCFNLEDIVCGFVSFPNYTHKYAQIGFRMAVIDEETNQILSFTNKTYGGLATTASLKPDYVTSFATEDSIKLGYSAYSDGFIIGEG